MSITVERKIALEKERREQIQNAALGLFFEKGYKKTTMSEIAETAGISKGLIYHYFKNKTEILFSFEEQLHHCLAEIEQYPSKKETIREFGKRFLLREPDESGYIPPLQVFVIVFSSGEMEDEEYIGKNPLYQDIGRTYFGPLFKKGIEDGEFRKGNPEIFGDIYWHYLLGNILEIMNNDNQKEPASSVDDILALFEP